MGGEQAITIEMCLSGRELTEPRPSPDRRWVAFVVRWGSSAAVALVPAEGGPERLVSTAPEPAPGRGLGGGCLAWLPDSSALVYAARDGDLWLQPIPGGVPRRLTDVDPGRRIEAPAVAPDGSFVVATIDQAEVWRWPVAGGEPAPARIDRGDDDFVLDPYVTPCSTTVLWHAWNVPDMAWDRSGVRRVSVDATVYDWVGGEAAVQQPRAMPDGTTICVRDDTGWLNVWIGDRPLVDEPFEHAGPTWGSGQRSFAVSPDAGAVAFSRNERGFGRLSVADVTTGEVIELGRGVHGQIEWVGDTITALRSGARTPTQIVAYHADGSTTGRRAATGWARRVLAAGPVTAWDGVSLPEPELVEVDAGTVTLHARRYIAGRGRMLCWVHGGPTDQWQVEFMPRIAFWWSRGWDVLVPDPRGSTGHGRAYQQALRGEWGRLDVDDVAAVLAEAHRRRWARPESTVLIGSSSGGMTALGVAGLHAGSVAGVVALYPVTDLAVLAGESHRFEAHAPLGLVGPADDVERYRLRSPLAYADRITVPVLVLHGDADPVVPLASTLAFVARMGEAGRDVELVVMKGEGHGFRDPANRRADFELTARFLARVIAL